MPDTAEELQLASCGCLLQLACRLASGLMFTVTDGLLKGSSRDVR